jgi:Tfp pilus assembly protein PilN
MSSPAVETTGTNPLATRRELRRQRRDRWILTAVAAALLLALLTAAVVVVGRQHQTSPVTGSPGTIAVPLTSGLP